MLKKKSFASVIASEESVFYVLIHISFHIDRQYLKCLFFFFLIQLNQLE